MVEAMPELSHTLVCAFSALLFWTAIGWPLATRFLPQEGFALAIAPSLGWAVFNAAALPILFVTGFTSWTVALVAGTTLAAAAAVAIGSWRQALQLPNAPSLAYGAAALLALAPAIAIWPKFAGDGVRLTPQMYDHSKIAIIDDIARLGLPPGNPFFGDAEPHLAYYYLWHFSGAVLSKLLGVSGWEADIALTWFTAFASLTLMMALAVRFGGRRAALWVVLVSVPLSARPILLAALGQENYRELLSSSTGLQAWLAQSSWSPQHLAGACCVLLAVMLMARLVETPSRRLALVLVLVVAAGFESSAWIGGIAFVIAALPLGLVLLLRARSASHWRFVGHAALAAFLSLALVAPLLHDQYHAMVARRAGAPIAFDPYQVLGPAVPEAIRRLFDLPAFWLVLLPIEFPALYLAGAVTLAREIRDPAKPPEARTLIIALATLALAGFVVSWLLISTVLNNDLGWRAVLPSVMVLTIFAAIGFSRWTVRPVSVLALPGALLLMLGLPDGLAAIKANISGSAAPSTRAFAAAPALWAAVDDHVSPDERIANNPQSLGDLTVWPINISWALLADRRSCYAGWDLARTFVPLPPEQIDALEDLFQRVFAGTASVNEIASLAGRYQCRLIVVTPEDGAWTHDPFSDGAIYRLVEDRPGWRLYRATEDARP
jgi:hypothetical protein